MSSHWSVFRDADELEHIRVESDHLGANGYRGKFGVMIDGHKTPGDGLFHVTTSGKEYCIKPETPVFVVGGERE